MSSETLHPVNAFEKRIFATEARQAKAIARLIAGHPSDLEFVHANSDSDGEDGRDIFTFESKKSGWISVDFYDGVIDVSQSVATGASIRSCKTLPAEIEQLSHLGSRATGLRIRHVVDLDAEGKFKNKSRRAFDEVKRDSQIRETVFEATTDGYYNTQVFLLESHEGGRVIYFQRLEKSGGCSLEHTLHYGGN